MSRISQKGATGPLALRAGGLFQQSTDANLATLVGTRWDLSDGREVIFVSNAATAILTSGVLCQDAALISNHAGMATAAFTAYSGSTGKQAVVTVNLGATALTADQYQGGFLSVDSGAGIGQYLRIAGNAAALASGSGVITLEDSPNTALTTASVVSLIPPHGASVVINPTTPTNVPVGVTLYPLTASNYGFLVSKGLTGAISDSTAPGVGAEIAPSAITAGAIAKTSGTGTATIALTNASIGYAAVAAASATSHSVFVNL